jgi:hypothetical protein
MIYFIESVRTESMDERVTHRTRSFASFGRVSASLRIFASTPRYLQ